MKKIIFALLGLSLVGNVWLMVRSRTASERAAQDTGAMAERAARAADVAAAEKRRVAAEAVLHAFVGIDQMEPAALVKNLRALGAEEETIRAVLDGVLRRKFRAAMSAWRIERFRAAWWKGAASGTGMPTLRAMVTEPMATLLGTDPRDVDDAAVRYDFLSPEKRRLLALIDIDYGQLMKPGAGGAFSRAATKAEANEEQLLVQERRKDVMAALTPEERAEYELRFTGTADRNASRLANFGASEAEYRTLKPIFDAGETAFRAAAQSNNWGPEVTAVEQRTVDQVVAALGYDRALQYFWGASGAYSDVASVLRENNQPEANGIGIFQLAAETGERALAIHYDASLTADQKKDALLALQAAVRPQLDALVPPAAQAKLPDAAIDWFRIMGEGRYEQVRPMLMGSGSIGIAPVSVAAPATGAPRREPVVRPPGR